jgi:hypothetical protein
MVARLAKRLHGDRRRALPVELICEELNELAVAEARAVLIAPAEASPLPDDAGSRDALGNELERLYASLEAVTPDNHPRTARLLGSSNAKSDRGGRRGRARNRPGHRARERRSALPSRRAVAPCRDRPRRHLGRDAPPRRQSRDRGEAAEVKSVSAALSACLHCLQKGRGNSPAASAGLGVRAAFQAVLKHRPALENLSVEIRRGRSDLRS